MIKDSYRCTKGKYRTEYDPSALSQDPARGGYICTCYVPLLGPTCYTPSGYISNIHGRDKDTLYVCPLRAYMAKMGDKDLRDGGTEIDKMDTRHRKILREKVRRLWKTTQNQRIRMIDCRRLLNGCG